VHGEPSATRDGRHVRVLVGVPQAKAAMAARKEQLVAEQARVAELSEQNAALQERLAQSPSDAPDGGDANGDSSVVAQLEAANQRIRELTDQLAAEGAQPAPPSSTELDDLRALLEEQASELSVAKSRLAGSRAEVDRVTEQTIDLRNDLEDAESEIEALRAQLESRGASGGSSDESTREAELQRR